MKRISIGIICYLLLSCSQDALETVQDSVMKDIPDKESTECGVAVVKFDDSFLSEIENDLVKERFVTKSAEFNELQQLLGVVSMRRLFPVSDRYEERTRAEGLHKWYIVNYDHEITYTKASDNFKNFRGVEIVEPLRPVVRNDCFNDPWMSHQWHYHNDGSLSSNHIFGADINVLPVWESYTMGDEDVIVAVIDGGIDQNHEDLAANCIGGYNFVSDTPIITPHDHGTHVAGTIGAVNNNNMGVVGIAGGDYVQGKKGVSLLSCQIFQHTEEEKDDSADGAPAIKWAADHGAVIAQNSWGYSFDSYNDAKKTEIPQYLKESIDYFIKYAGIDENGNQTGPMKGGAVIFAAGNSGWDTDPIGLYSPVISVGAIGPQGTKTKYSNYGNWVDISAPGGDAKCQNGLVYSTLPHNQYGGLQGTSMACPHVSGVAALIVSYYGGADFTAEDLRKRLINGANPEFSDSQKIGPLVDALGSMTTGGHIAPDSVEDLKVTYRNGELHFLWSVTRDQDNIKAYGYKIFVTKRIIDLQGGVSSIPLGVDRIDVKTKNRQVGEQLSAKFSKVQLGQTYYVSIVAYDKDNNLSKMSEIITIRLPENRPPVINPLQEIPASLRIGAHDSLEYMFEINDPDGHRVNVSLRNAVSASGLTERNESIYSLTISGNAYLRGVYEAVISASDEFGVTSEYVIYYELLPNMAPYANKEIGDLIISSLGEQIQINLSDCFVDPDGGELEYELYYSDPDIMMSSQDGDKVRLTAMNYGITEVSVTASDPCGESAEIRFKVAVRNGSETLIYPNPVVEFLYISVPEAGNAEIKIVSQSGNIEFNRNMSLDPFKSIRIDMRKFPAGIYHLSMDGDNVHIEKQLLKI